MFFDTNPLMFNDFLNANKAKIGTFAPTNPFISLTDEWRDEDCWDTDYRAAISQTASSTIRQN